MATDYKDFKFLLFILILIWILWFISGGVARIREEGTGAFITPVETPFEQSEVYGPTIGGESVPVNSEGIPIPNTWKRYDTTDFVLFAPPEYVYTDVSSNGYYSFTLTKGTTKFTVDYGTLVESLVKDNDTRYIIGYEKIDGKDARYVKPNAANANIAEVYIDRGGLENFSIYGTDLTSSGINEMYNIASTVDFR